MILLNNPIIEKKQFPVWFYYLRLKNTTVSSRNTPNLWQNVDYLTLHEVVFLTDRTDERTASLHDCILNTHCT